MEGGARLPCRTAPGGLLLAVRVTPKASLDSVVGCETRGQETVLAVKVRALPDKGEANDAVIGLLAKWLDEPKFGLKLAAGGKARLKQVFVAGDPAALMEKVAARLFRKEEANG